MIGTSEAMIDAAYYGTPRLDIESLLPSQPRRVLEVGSGAGATIAWLRGLWPETHFTAIESQEEVFKTLEQVADVAIRRDLNTELPQVGQFDLILALDVLEHLVDPWTTLRDLSSRLSTGGTVIVSVPNVARLSVALPLMLKGEFRYVSNGILDRTHLRFFTPMTAVELMNHAGLIVESGVMTGLSDPRIRAVDIMSFGRLRSRLALQTVMGGRAGVKQQPVEWRAVASAYVR
jgi:SAM-dependent methyltransferase